MLKIKYLPEAITAGPKLGLKVNGPVSKICATVSDFSEILTTFGAFSASARFFMIPIKFPSESIASKLKPSTVFPNLESLLVARFIWYRWRKTS